MAKRTDDVEFMFVWVYNLFLHFQQKNSLETPRDSISVNLFVWVLVYKK